MSPLETIIWLIKPPIKYTTHKNSCWESSHQLNCSTVSTKYLPRESTFPGYSLANRASLPRSTWVSRLCLDRRVGGVYHSLPGRPYPIKLTQPAKEERRNIVSARILHVRLYFNYQCNYRHTSAGQINSWVAYRPFPAITADHYHIKSQLKLADIPRLSALWFVSVRWLKIVIG